MSSKAPTWSRISMKQRWSEKDDAQLILFIWTDASWGFVHTAFGSGHKKAVAWTLWDMTLTHRSFILENASGFYMGHRMKTQ